MITIRSMLKDKKGMVWSVTPQSSVLDALELMAARSIGAVMVMDGERLVGIFSERDYARRGVLQGRDVNAKIDEVMTSPVFAISPDRPVEDCLAIMTERHFRHLPVMEDGKVVGVVSIGDLGKALIDDQLNQISGLENYIMGR
jgi:CBS domain-containing protein